MTPEQRRDAFLSDLQAVLNRHKAEIDVTDDGRPYGLHSGLVRVTLDTDGDLPFTEFNLTGFMTADPATTVSAGQEGSNDAR